MKHLLLITITLAFLPAVSPGTMIVHDPGNAALNSQNLIQTTTTALKQVAAYAQQVQQYQLQIRQFQTELLQATGLQPALQIWQDAQGTFNQMKGVVNMFSDSGGLQDYLQNAKDINYWLSTPVNQYTSRPTGYWSTTQKTANDQLVQEISQQEQELAADSQSLARLQSQAGSTVGTKAALDVANEMGGLAQKQLMEIRALLIAQQQTLASRNAANANDEAMKQAATQQYFGTQLGPQPHTGW
jgi:type IV secretion system protein TrbJ